MRWAPVPEVAIAGMRPQRWRGRTLGGAALFRVCVAALPLAGVRGAWLVAWIIAAGFMLAGGRNQFGMLQWWRRLRPRAGTLVHWMLAYRQFASFGRIMCDRFLVWQRPHEYRIGFIGLEGLRAVRRWRQGCILLSAHVGNWEMSSYWLHTIAGNVGKVHVVMVRDDVEFVQRFVDERLRGDFTHVIDPRDGIGASLAINAAIADGDMVCMLADRVFGDQPAVEVDFMGGRVRLPIGPFHTAMMTGAPIMVGFLVKTGLRRYVVQVDDPWWVRMPERRGDRPAAIQAAVQRWARRLELQARRYPQQWHNFYNYWEE
jgi:predicted LPLAT superfamily acyltransferase